MWIALRSYVTCSSSFARRRESCERSRREAIARSSSSGSRSRAGRAALRSMLRAEISRTAATAFLKTAVSRSTIGASRRAAAGLSLAPFMTRAAKKPRLGSHPISTRPLTAPRLRKRRGFFPADQGRGFRRGRTPWQQPNAQISRPHDLRRRSGGRRIQIANGRSIARSSRRSRRATRRRRFRTLNPSCREMTTPETRLEARRAAPRAC